MGRDGSSRMSALTIPHSGDWASATGFGLVVHRLRAPREDPQASTVAGELMAVTE